MNTGDLVLGHQRRLKDYAVKRTEGMYEPQSRICDKMGDLWQKKDHDGLCCFVSKGIAG